VRMTVAVVDLLAVALALSPGLRRMAARRRLALAAIVALVALAPLLGRFRDEDRERAFARSTPPTRPRPGATPPRGAGSTVTQDAARSPSFGARHLLPLPGDGPRLERRAIYVNVNREDFHRSTSNTRFVASSKRRAKRSGRAAAQSFSWGNGYGGVRLRWKPAHVLAAQVGEPGVGRGIDARQAAR